MRFDNEILRQRWSYLFFQSLNEFIFKEIAVTRIEEDAIPSVYILRPPYDFDKLLPKNQSQNHWLEMDYHGISWYRGDIAYKELGRLLRSRLGDAKAIYVKGLEKKKWLERYVDNVENIEDRNCPALRKLTLTSPVFCTHHQLCLKPVCAAVNVAVIKEWALKHLNKCDKKSEEMEDEVLNTMYC
ncbi:hypothetical protein QAD02_020453 [Eretmocerus hayati]|uniref:Uncharacterized protein n=1 Tax=Eretmocerus hayati TaxID=131215 RepID=A0ACC2PSA1_9HYME|nr:hypothetical protein QAD02_020453 [Eretmocerus hayati]